MPTLIDDRARAEVTGIGVRLKTMRVERGWTQDEVASRAGLSKSYLSRIEEGDRQPSIAALLSISAAFDVPLNAIFGGDLAQELSRESVDSGRCGIVRAGSVDERLGNGLSYRPLLSSNRDSNIQPIAITVPANRSGDELYRHEGEEWLYVLRGSLSLTLDAEKFELHAGDAAHFDASIPHRLTALNGVDAEILLVACALPRKLLSSYL